MVLAFPVPVGPSASASSATRTGYRREYRAGLSASQQRVGVGSDRRMGYNASEQMFRYCVRWLWGYQRDRKLSLIHISEPTRRTPISYAVFCLKKKKKKKQNTNSTI